MCYLYGEGQRRNRQKIQVVLNDTATWIHVYGRRTAKKMLMKLCNWLDMEEMTSL